MRKKGNLEREGSCGDRRQSLLGHKRGIDFFFLKRAELQLSIVSRSSS